MKRALLAAAIAIVAAAVYWTEQEPSPATLPDSAPAARAPSRAAQTQDNVLARAFEERRSNLQVMVEGVVAKTLADDERGSRHQRFILALANGQTVLVAHNIDLASRIDALRNGDAVGVHGQYEWNERGGVIHWTHRDPRGTHIGGWIKHQGRTYQ
jgi:hypothetical protein